MPLSPPPVPTPVPPLVPPRSCSAALGDLMRALGDELVLAPALGLHASAIDRPLIAGPLLKLDSISAEWKQRHFELVGDQLAMFKSPNADAPMAVLPITRCKGFYHADLDAWVLRVSGYCLWSDGATHKRVWTLKCPDAQTMRLWANAMKVTTTATTRAHSSRESYLILDESFSFASRSRSSPAPTSVGSYLSTRSYDDSLISSPFNPTPSPVGRQLMSPSPAPQFERVFSPTSHRFGSPASSGSLSPTNDFQLAQLQQHSLRFQQQQRYRATSPSSRLATDSAVISGFYPAPRTTFSVHSDDAFFAQPDVDYSSMHDAPTASMTKNVITSAVSATSRRHISADYSNRASVDAYSTAVSPQIRRSQSAGAQGFAQAYPAVLPASDQKNADFSDQSFSNLSSVQPEEILPSKKNWFRFLKKK